MKNNSFMPVIEVDQKHEVKANGEKLVCEPENFNDTKIFYVLMIKVKKIINNDK